METPQALAPHPAKFNDAILTKLNEIVRKEIGPSIDDPPPWPLYRILDPFAGTGRIHELGSIPGVDTWGVELEPEWSMYDPRTITFNALDVRKIWEDESFDAIITSPCYGNRMADHHNASDDSTRNTYKHKLGRDLSPGSSAVMQWGLDYRQFHRKVWQQCVYLLKPGGVFVINVKDHIRGDERQRVTQWHMETILSMELTLVSMDKVAAGGNRQGANGQKRIGYESIITMRLPF